MLNLYWRLRHRLEFLKPKNLRSDRSVIIRQYEKRLGVKPDLEHPETYTEKIQWLKLHYRPEILTTLADKCLAREYIKERVGEEYLVPLVFCTDNVYDIRPEKLPDYPVIIKTNHDSGGGIFVFDKNRVSYKDIRKKLVDRLRKNYYYPKREWQYKNIKPKIIVEKLLMDEKGNIPYNYSVLCLNGNPTILSIFTDPDKNPHQPDVHENFMIENFERLGPITNRKEVWNAYRNQKQIDLPANIRDLIDISREMSRGFPLMRVDLYSMNRNIFVGELTLTPSSGFSKYINKWNILLGKKLLLQKMQEKDR